MHNSARTLVSAILFLYPLSLKANEVLDPFDWLEEVNGTASTKWVTEQNKLTVDRLWKSADFEARRSQALEILQSNENIVEGDIIGEYVYDFHRDKTNVDGIWRRTAWNDFRDGHPRWESLLDLDKLNKAEKKAYKFASVDCLRPQYTQCLLGLSIGGSDTTEFREYDPKKNEFVKGGFTLPPSKSELNWLDSDTLLVADATQKESLTDSGYPRVVKIWHRNTKVDNEKAIFEVSKTDIKAYTSTFFDGDRRHIIIGLLPPDMNNKRFLYNEGKMQPLALPDFTMLRGIVKGRVLFSNKKNLADFVAGSLLQAPLDSLLKGKPEITSIITPTEFQTINSVMVTNGSTYLNILEHVRSRILRLSLVDGKWNFNDLPTEKNGSIRFVSANEENGNLLFVYEDLITPTGLYAFESKDSKVKLSAKLPPRFDSSELQVNQKFVESSDGVKVPYFLVTKKNIKLDGKNPTILYGYGGFSISMTPVYMSLSGKLWLEKGGAFAFANIRGGGEYGPKWHDMAKRENKQKSFDDFIAVARELIKDKVTSPQHLGIRGGSNGGLLVGAVLTQHPELFNAVVCESPLLDMMRFHKLMAGASWADEYGNPEDSKDAAFLIKYSPFHNLDPKVKYPETLFMTSRNDDRVHPGHARKMAARMTELKNKVLYFEALQGGHFNTSQQEAADTMAMAMTFFWEKLGD